jgi:Na+/phosphate symporter
MKFIKCFSSFLIGAYITILLSFSIFSVILYQGFVAKASLTTQHVIVDGERYTCKKAN